MTNVLERPLAGIRIGLSISESDDSKSRGFPASQVNHVSVQMATALLGQGASVVFGHDWRPDGVMEAIHAVALRMQAPIGSYVGQHHQPPLLNVLPWPDEPRLIPDERARLQATLRIEKAGLPADLQADPRGPSPGDEWKYFRARGLTHMRKLLLANTEARICLGGRVSGSQGRFAGIVEEAYLSVEKSQPIFLTGLLGGATREVIEAVKGQPNPSAVGAPGDLDRLYSAYGNIQMAGADAVIDRQLVWGAFGSGNVHGISQSNGLDPDENLDLFNTSVVERAIQLILLGLTRLKTAGKFSRAQAGRSMNVHGGTVSSSP